MVVSTGLQAHALELLSVLGQASARRMFGGAGIRVDGLFLALIAGEVLYLKADAIAQPAFQAAGCQPFTYTAAGGKRAVMAYWSAPEPAMESPAQMLPWARLALDSALRAAAAKRPAALPKAATRPAHTAAPKPAAGRRRKTS